MTNCEIGKNEKVLVGVGSDPVDEPSDSDVVATCVPLWTPGHCMREPASAGAERPLVLTVTVRADVDVLCRRVLNERERNIVSIRYVCPEPALATHRFHQVIVEEKRGCVSSHLHTRTVPMSRDKPTSTDEWMLGVAVVVRLQAAWRADSGVKIAAAGLQALPSVVPKVGVVAENEASATTGRRAARYDDGLVDPSPNQVRALRQDDGGVLEIGLRLEPHRRVRLQVADLRAARLARVHVCAHVHHPGQQLAGCGSCCCRRR